MRMEMLASADMAWTSFLGGGDDFSVEDLLVEPEHEEGLDQEAEADSFGTSNQTSSSSAASFEPQQHLSMELDFHTTEDVAELEWVSRFVDDTFFEFPSESKNHQADHATPVTNLLSERPVTVPVKARSKRSRTMSNLSWSSSNSCSTTCSKNPRNLFEKKKRGRKKKMHYQMVRSERKCGHCGVEKTPQWRAGPMGAKTLCNACGVRFKSGRLLPEYRPACSPTFVSSVHSNSHRKVMEMRRKKAEEEPKQQQQQQKNSNLHSGRI